MNRAHRPRRVRAAFSSLVAAVLVASGTAWATTIDFQIFEPTTGSLTYAPSINPRLFGTNIEIDSVLGTGTPSNSGSSFDCIDCRLNFITGNFLFPTANGWVFAGGGSSISIVGGIDTDGDNVADIVGNTLANPLLAGIFTSPQLTVDLLPGAFGAGFTLAAFFDIKHPELTGLFGLPPFPYEGTLALSWAGVADPPGAILASPRNGTVSNNFVPEPGITFLLAAGLLGLAGHRRRRGPRIE